MIISVEPAHETVDDTRWGIFIFTGSGTVCVGVSKHSFDCDSAAERLAKGFRALLDDPTQVEVRHYAVLRPEIMAHFERVKKEKKSGIRGTS